MDRMMKEELKVMLNKEFFDGVVSPILDFVEVACNPANYPRLRARVLRRANDYLRAMNSYIDKMEE
jgi:hypothetical protein